MSEKKQERKQERSLEAWSPFREFGSGLGRVFDELLAERSLPSMRWTPALDVTENDKAYIVTVELPGAKRDDITLEMHEDVLTIHGEKKSEREEKDERRHYVERMYGSFSRSFRLPAPGDPDGIKANFQAGVLTVEIPKTEAPKPRVIDIKTG
ncbi:Hsp20/alpha crystallin family protein [Myxococcota bacterium]|nr:Hsp20/alpha crystallin family protein [Myxococcota bacterium]MCZ7618112.1 Hsp20/alpha crystallin family protein [Myxococcota bacterium]